MYIASLRWMLSEADGVSRRYVRVKPKIQSPKLRMLPRCQSPRIYSTRSLSLNLYVDMAELHLESWLFESENQEKPLANLFKRHQKPVTHILIWTHHTQQCWLESTMSIRHTSWAMAYMSTIIIGCYRKFEGYGCRGCLRLLYR